MSTFAPGTDPEYMRQVNEWLYGGQQGPPPVNPNPTSYTPIGGTIGKVGGMGGTNVPTEQPYVPTGPYAVSNYAPPSGGNINVDPMFPIQPGGIRPNEDPTIFGNNPPPTTGGIFPSHQPPFVPKTPTEWWTGVPDKPWTPPPSQGPTNRLIQDWIRRRNTAVPNQNTGGSSGGGTAPASLANEHPGFDPLARQAYLQMTGGGMYGGVIPGSLRSPAPPGNPWDVLQGMGIEDPRLRDQNQNPLATSTSSNTASWGSTPMTGASYQTSSPFTQNIALNTRNATRTHGR